MVVEEKYEEDLEIESEDLGIEPGDIEDPEEEVEEAVSDL